MNRLTGFEELIVVEKMPYGKDMVFGKLYFKEILNVGKWLGYLCPCGCGQEVSIPFRGGVISKGQLWDYTTSDGKTISIYPSVLMKTGCKSHYFILENNIDWI